MKTLLINIVRFFKRTYFKAVYTCSAIVLKFRSKLAYRAKKPFSGLWLGLRSTFKGLQAKLQ